MNENNKIINVDITKYIEYLMIGEKVTNYKTPIIIERINEYNDIITIYTKNIKSHCLAFDKDNFYETIKTFLKGEQK